MAGWSVAITLWHDMQVPVSGNPMSALEPAFA